MAVQKSKKSYKNYTDDNAKTHAHLQTMTKEPAKFQIDRLKNVLGVAHTRYPPSVFKCLKSRKGNNMLMLYKKNQ